MKTLAAALHEGGEARAQALAILAEPGCVEHLSFQAEGCRLVQLAMDVADRHTAAKLAHGLQGHVARAVQSPHANYVVQRVIKVLTPQEAPFVVEELAEASLDLAQHEYGCRIYCRLLEHSASDWRTRCLVDEVLVDMAELVQHKYGHHVAEWVLEHGLPNQRQQVVSALRRDLSRSLQSRNATYVLEKALACCDADVGRALMCEILDQGPQEVAALVAGPSGHAFVPLFMRQGGQISQRFRALLSHPGLQAQICSTRNGRRTYKQLFSESVRIQPGGA